MEDVRLAEMWSQGMFINRRHEEDLSRELANVIFFHLGVYGPPCMKWSRLLLGRGARRLPPSQESGWDGRRRAAVRGRAGQGNGTPVCFRCHSASAYALRAPAAFAARFLLPDCPPARPGVGGLRLQVYSDYNAAIDAGAASGVRGLDQEGPGWHRVDGYQGRGGGSGTDGIESRLSCECRGRVGARGVGLCVASNTWIY